MNDFLDTILGPDGKIVPSQEAIDAVEKNIPDAATGDKFRMAQAMTLTAAIEKQTAKLAEQNRRIEDLADRVGKLEQGDA